MRLTWGALHGIIAIAWLALLLAFGVAVAVLGAEESALSRQRGDDREAQRDLHYERERIGVALEREARPALIEDAVRRLDLPLAPTRLASSRGGSRPQP